MKPLVSIIVPVYNAEAFLEETLRSLAACTYEPLEVVTVDDGSTDGSLHILENFARQDARFRVFRQANAGVSVARNHAIRESRGTYILPVDSDNLIEPSLIDKAVKVLEQRAEVKGVGCRADFFGERSGEWKVEEYSPRLLARKNMLDACAMYRRSDYEQTGGYMEGLQVREDWDFWLSMLEKGGTFYRIPEILLHYRVRSGSKRVRDREQKRELIRVINQRHHDFIYEQLGGPLHYHRSWSRLLNLLRSEKIVGDFRNWEDGDIIYQKRNILRRYEGCIIKQFAIPNLWRGIIYGLFTKSKARRSYEYGLRLGELTPAPIAYREVRVLGILRESWYVCRESECTHTFNELIGHPEMEGREQILKAIGRFTAQLHRQGIWHMDYSGGNILWECQGQSAECKVQVIDLNRMRFHLPQEPLLGFERLNIDREALRTMAYAYAEVQGLDPEATAEYVITHRWHKHIKQGITNL